MEGISPVSFFFLAAAAFGFFSASSAKISTGSLAFGVAGFFSAGLASALGSAALALAERGKRKNGLMGVKINQHQVNEFRKRKKKAILTRRSITENISKGIKIGFRGGSRGGLLWLLGFGGGSGGLWRGGKDIIVITKVHGGLGLFCRGSSLSLGGSGGHGGNSGGRGEEAVSPVILCFGSLENIGGLVTAGGRAPANALGAILGGTAQDLDVTLTNCLFIDLFIC